MDSKEVQEYKIPTILCVAERPSVALKIVEILSGKQYKILPVISKYNPVYEFPFQTGSTKKLVRFTSVLGQVMAFQFPENCKVWKTTKYYSLMHEPLTREILKTSELVANNLKNQATQADELILWTDGDMDGEVIANDIANICLTLNPALKVKRAHFSCIERREINNSFSNLTPIDYKTVKVVEATQEVYLRINSILTRFMTLNFKKILQLGIHDILCYDPLQFLVLEIIYNRWKANSTFIPQKHWYLTLRYDLKYHNNTTTSYEFQWERGQIFDKTICSIIYERCMRALKSNQKIQKSFKIVSKVIKRPLPLNTQSLIKLVCSCLKISSMKAMEVSEKLYSKGYISFPRTSTNIFPDQCNLMKSIRKMRKNSDYGEFAAKISEANIPLEPRKGKITDGRHPPIYPILYPLFEKDLSTSEWKVYNLICKHFLACNSQDAIINESQSTFTICGETFKHTAKFMTKPGFLEILNLNKIINSEAPHFNNVSKLSAKIVFNEGSTNSPDLPQETEIIHQARKVDKFLSPQIFSEISVLLDRKYCQKIDNNLFPTTIGMILHETFCEIRPIPNLILNKQRIQIKLDQIKSDLRSKQEVTLEIQNEIEADFNKLLTKHTKIKNFIQERFDYHQSKSSKVLSERDLNVTLTEEESILKDLAQDQSKEDNSSSIKEIIKEMISNMDFTQCHKCKAGRLKVKFNSKKEVYFIACSNFPQCNITTNLCSGIKSISMKKDEKCANCDIKGRDTSKFQIEFYPKCYQNHRVRLHFIDPEKLVGSFCIFLNCDSTFRSIRAAIGQQFKPKQFPKKPKFASETKKFFKSPVIIRRK